MTTIEITYKLIQNYGTVPPALGNFFRMALSAIVILLYIAMTGRFSRFLHILKIFPKFYVAASIIGIFGGILVFMYGLALTEPAPAAAIFSSNPIIINAVSILFLKETEIIGLFLIKSKIKVKKVKEELSYDLGNEN